jgi:hypothetical protein
MNLGKFKSKVKIHHTVLEIENVDFQTDVRTEDQTDDRTGDWTRDWTYNSTGD